MTSETKTIFISRAGSDDAIGAEIGRLLEAAGYTVILQQWDFGNRNFVERMHAALADGARVVGLLSPDYLLSDFCAAEWMNAIAGDPLNREGRLILLRVDECEAPGMLAGLAYWDLVPLRGDRALLGEIVLRAVGGGRESPQASPFWRASRTILDPDAIRPTESFSGREAELAALQEQFDQPNAIVALHGPGGIGKSSLAREYAWRRRDDFAVVWWLSAANETEIIDALVALGALFVRDLERLSDRRAAAKQVVTSVLGGFAKPIFFVFDNLEEEGLLHRWRPLSGARALVTSRTAHWGGDVRAVPLRRWPPEIAGAYLIRESGRNDLSADDAHRIAARLDGLPLALAHAAAYLKATHTVSAERYLARIDEQMRRAPRGASYPRSVFATFQEQIHRAELEAPGAAALACMAAFFAPAAIPEALFATPAGTPPAELRPKLNDVEAQDLHAVLGAASELDEALGALDRLSLVDFEPATRTFDMHRLVQGAARDLVADPKPWASAALAALNVAFPATIDYRAWPACEPLLLHGMAAAQNVAQHHLDEATASLLLHRVATYLDARGYCVEAEELHRQVLALRESTLGAEHFEVTQSLNSLGNAIYQQGRYLDAQKVHARALELRRRAQPPDDDAIAVSLNNLGNAAWGLADYAQAAALYEQATAILERVHGGESPRVAEGLNNVAFVYTLQGRFADAERLHRRALAIREHALQADDPSVAYSLSNLGDVYCALERHDDAEALYERALALRERALGPDHPLTAYSLDLLAGVRLRQGRAAEAATLARRALMIAQHKLGSEHPDTLRYAQRLRLAQTV